MTPPSRPLVLLLLCAVAAAAVALAATLDHGFVYDDHRFVEGNDGLDGVASAPWTAFHPGTTTAEGPEPGMWRPLRTLSFAADRVLLGRGPAGHHIASALLHGAATALVFGLGWTLGLGDLPAAAGAALFAFHPVQAETVAWISSRGDLLAAVFVLAAVLLHLRRGPWWGTALLASLGLLSKESAVVAPLLLAAADLAAGGAGRVRDRWRPVAAVAGVLAALVAVRSVVLPAAEGTFGQGAGLGLGPGGVFVALPSMFAWYGGRLLLPSPGTFDQQLEPSVLLALLCLAGLALVASLGRLGPLSGAAGPLQAGVLWMVAALLPVTLLQLLFPLKILVADRFLYLALAGPALGVAAAAGTLAPSLPRWLLVGSPLLLLATLPATARWESDASLWGDTLARSPGNGRALHGLAHASEERPGEALGLYRAAVEALPGNAVAWFRKGLMEERLALGAEDRPSRTGLGLSAVDSLQRAILLWLEGETEGRARGLLEARLARAALLASLGREAAAADEATQAAVLWREAPGDLRRGLAARARILRNWARSTGREDILAGLGPEEAP